MRSTFIAIALAVIAINVPRCNGCIQDAAKACNRLSWSIDCCGNVFFERGLAWCPVSSAIDEIRRRCRGTDAGISPNNSPPSTSEGETAAPAPPPPPPPPPSEPLPREPPPREPPPREPPPRKPAAKEPSSGKSPSRESSPKESPPTKRPPTKHFKTERPSDEFFSNEFPLSKSSSNKSPSNGLPSTESHLTESQSAQHAANESLSTKTSTSEPSATGLPTMGSSPTTNTSSHNDQDKNDRDDWSGGLGASGKVALGVTIPLAVLLLLLVFILWLRQRRKKGDFSSLGSQSPAAQEIQPMVYEISGTEIRSTGVRHNSIAELEAAGIDVGENTTLSMPDKLTDSKLLFGKAVPRATRSGDGQQAGKLGNSQQAAPVNPQPQNSGFRDSELAPSATPDSNTISSISPSGHGISPISPVSPMEPLGTLNLQSQRTPSTEPSLKPITEEEREKQGLPSKRETVERWRSEGALRLQKWQMRRMKYGPENKRH
ncbi:hypothetical protein AJ79_01734 [Helicocarpus griseus UAMH5409]|uniref:Extracellular membrane protein CFEM domain-containing protein n=1 Tax=Helicocarpus griseus UAMH5409 TaxID=1447875 RepID=A0A2B7Y5V5_9EURO|nr:hypothetical protein AJ79_01734 [Helicocarpus griseus UAMH5409]